MPGGEEIKFLPLRLRPSPTMNVRDEGMAQQSKGREVGFYSIYIYTFDSLRFEIRPKT